MVVENLGDGHLKRLDGKRVMAVASTGGHLAQMHTFISRYGLAAQCHWITFDHPQSNSLLQGQSVTFVGYIASRDVAGCLRAITSVFRTLRRERPEVVISTGAAIALVALPIARCMGIPVVYIESVSRFDGPSLTGRILQFLPGLKRYTQHHRWANRLWLPGPSVLTSFKPYVRTPSSEAANPRVFVTLGTIKPYGFPRALSAIRNALPIGAQVRVQYGETEGNLKGWDARKYMSGAEVAGAIEWADVVVSHAGVGTALRILEAGKVPILLARRVEHGEHVDGHQIQIARELAALGVAIAPNVEDLNAEHFALAARTRVCRELDERSGPRES